MACFAMLSSKRAIWCCIDRAMGTKELLETSEIPEMDEEELVELKTKGRIFQDIPKVKEMYQRLRYAYAAYGGSDENVAIRSHVSQGKEL